MNSKIFMILRILLGVFVLVFGLNKFLNFLPAPEGMSEAAGAYFGALMSAKVISLGSHCRNSSWISLNI